ncbi:MAG: hypothetical protein II021_03490, partial [Oscillospiraceae bacterium]|nr:hypothetical protein [Oscillospiraceae bacterium]
MKSKLKALSILGVVIILIGAYYLFFKAGLPYQDATEELLQRWEAAYRTGSVLCVIDAAVLLLALVLYLLKK